MNQGHFRCPAVPPISNNITIDGLDNNDDRRRANVSNRPLKRLEEVQVITNQFSAGIRASLGRPHQTFARASG
jgi:hypothetical protein